MLLNAIARVLVKHVGNAVGFGVGGSLILDIWDLWNQARPSQQEKRDDLVGLAQQTAETTKKEAKRIVQEVAGDRSEAEKLTLATYLMQVPAQTRKSLRRTEDPTGTTVPSALPIGSEKIAAILPPKLPRFKEGDRAGAGVDFVLKELLGVGGFGEVWKAINPHMLGDPPVALKFCLDETAAKSLRNEAALLGLMRAKEKHPGIVQLRQTYLNGQPPFLEYEYVEGGDLASAVYGYQASKKGPLPPREASKIVYQLAQTVGQAHKLNPPVVHRDLKPANVLVRRRPDGKTDFLITDFGIGGIVAKQVIDQTQSGSLSLMTSMAGAYTPLYASPQQIKGEPADPRDDVHALGVIWYQMLLGDFSEGAPRGSYWADEFRQRGLDERLVRLLGECVEPKAQHRPQDAVALAEQIKIIIWPPNPTTKVTIISSANPSICSQPVTFTATVEVVPPATGLATGKLTFRNGQTDLGTVTLSDGAATLTTSALGAGDHNITAYYGRHGGFLESTSATLTQTVQQKGPPDKDPVSTIKQDLKEALEESRTKANDRTYFERQGLSRVGAWQTAAQQGNAPAQWLFARCLQEGIGVEKDPKAAVVWLRQAAESGLAIGQNDLGVCYHNGEGVEKNPAEAVRWYTRAVEQGDAWGQINLGACYWEGVGVTKDLVEAVRLCRKAAEQGWAAAQNDLGNCYHRGGGVPQDHAEAVRWFRKAAESGYPEAQVNLGFCYDQGAGVDKDSAEAARWYRRAAEMGHPSGQDFLGLCYFNGEGVEQDYPQALIWFRKAAENGLASAQVNLGYCYQRGKGVKKDLVKAAEWFRKAAEQENDEGQFALGACYDKGGGVAQNRSQAEHWYTKAAAQGHRRAKNALKRLQKGEKPEPADEDQDEAEAQTFNAMLREAGIAPKEVRLIRHKDNRAEKGRTPYDLWHHNRAQFELYQSTQSFENRAKLTAKYWAVFLGMPDGKTMFVGIYNVRYRGVLERDQPAPHLDAIEKAGSCDVYDLTLQNAMSHLIGKLFIDWGLGALAWIQYADRQDKPITELPEEFEDEAGRREGEAKLRQAHRHALNISMGKSSANEVDVSKFCRQHGIPTERAAAILNEVWEQWRKDRKR